jgi:hypothetical protein
MHRGFFNLIGDFLRSTSNFTVSGYTPHHFSLTSIPIHLPDILVPVR